MPDISPILSLPYLQASQAQKHVTHNEALRRLDILVQLGVAGFGALAPPPAPEDGEIYALGAGATGAWAGRDGDLAAWLDGSWYFLTPQEGWRAWSRQDAALRIWNGADWVLPPAATDNLDGLGIGLAADAVNRLAVRSEAALLTHDGAGHQLKINKAGSADTAALLFQTGWTGHAEMGLAGSDDFTIKVSPDGAGWTEALRLAADTGLAAGAAVQTAADDATPGRLLTVGAFGLGAAAAAILADMDATDTPAGFYRMTSATLNRPDGPAEGVVTIRRADGGAFCQTVAFSSGAGALRYYAGGGFTGWSVQYGANNVLGPVGEAGGVPTGGLIERGSNANGHYARFADGTQICTEHFNAGATSHAWVFPAAFGNTGQGRLNLTAMARLAGGPRIITENYDLSATGVTFNVWDVTGAPAPAQIYATAIGLWF